MNVDGIKALVRLTEQDNMLSAQIKSEEDRRQKVESLRNIVAYCQQKIDSFGFFERLFNRARYNMTRKSYEPQISTLNEQIKVIEGSKQDLQPLQHQLETTKKDIVFVQQEFRIPKLLIENLQVFSISEDGHLVIDASKMKVGDSEQLTYQYRNKGSNEEFTSDQLVMVHKTDRFPQDDKILTNFDGKKTFNRYTRLIYGVCTKAASCRQTSHYTLNNVVQSHAYGNWSQSGICILEEFSQHQDEFACTFRGDAYTRQSVELSSGAIKAVTPKVYETLTDEQKGQDNIVIVKAETTKDFDRAAYIIMAANNKPFLYGDSQTAVHAHSEDKKYESVWEISSKIFEFLRLPQSVYDKELTLQGDNLCQYAYLAQRAIQSRLSWGPIDGYFKTTDEQGEEVKVSKSIVSAFLYGGFRRNEDGSFTRTDDYKTLMDGLEKLQSLALSDKTKYLGVIDTYIKDNGLIQLQQQVNAIQQKFDSQQTPTIEDVLQMPMSQLVTFDNLKALQVVGDYLYENFCDEKRGFGVSPEGLVVTAEYSTDAQEDRTYIPIDGIDTANERQFVVPIFSSVKEGQPAAERTLAESIEIAQQVQIIEPWKQTQTDAAVETMPQQ